MDLFSCEKDLLVLEAEEGRKKEREIVRERGGERKKESERERELVDKCKERRRK